jgi:DNA (cytosine-5)-methyltransferase 1
MNKIRVIELFAGYGSQHLALKRLKRDYPEFEYEVVAFCEIDENAIKAYHALHGDHIPNLGDITQVNPSDVPDCDLMTWSFPCQSISSAGLQHGLAEGSGTRSSLCWNAMRIFEAKRPKYLLMENVSALVSDKFIGDFNLLQSSLQKIGYTNFTQLMNAKDYGVPQNRLRVFMVSVLDCQQAYYFPKPFPLERRLKDVLETNVPDRYYLSQERLAGLKLSNEKEKEAGRGFEFAPKSADSVGDNAVCTNAGGRKTDNFLQEPCVETVGQYDSSQNSRIIDPNGISQAVINGHKDGTPKITEPCIYNRPHGYFGGDINEYLSPSIAATESKVHKYVIQPMIQQPHEQATDTTIANSGTDV